MSRSVYAQAPTRIDFAGGTLDIYPLFLFLNGGITLNAAIDQYAQVWLTQRDDDRVVITSRDTGAALDQTGGVDALPIDGPLSLITRVLRYYRVPGGIEVTTHMMPPHGSGLGASSSLFIAMSHAVLAYLNQPRDNEQIIRISNHLEAQLMGMPAGTQDYYPPTYGGISAIHYEIEGIWHEAIDPDGAFQEELQQYIIVSYTNQTHHSGTTNWSKMRNFFDAVPDTVRSFQQIKVNADHFYQAFKARDIQRIAQLLEVEWETRKGLSTQVTNPEIDRIIDAARDAGAWSSKLCGAGGGGCMLTLAPPEAHQQVISALKAAGATFMDTHMVNPGVKIEITE